MRGELFDRRRHGRGEEERLTLTRQDGRDFAQVVDEAHVEHVVGFVEDEDLDLVETHRTLADVVKQTAWRGDENVDAAEHGLLLLVHRGAAENDGGAETKEFAVDAEAIADLRGEFARRREHQCAAGFLAGEFAVLVQAIEDRQREGGGFAGAGLGKANEVPALLDDGKRLDLDWRRLGVALGLKRFEDRRGNAEVLECGHYDTFGRLQTQCGSSVQERCDGEERRRADA